MKHYSFHSNIERQFIWLFCMVIFAAFSGCYSFTGGTKEAHLNTIYIAPVIDRSGFGSPTVREELNLLLIEKFRNDNTYTVTEAGGDAKLNVIVTSITETPHTVQQGGGAQLETERKVTVTCTVEYYDAVKKKQIWSKSFSNYDIYEVANLQTGRLDAIREALDQVSDDILLGVVSGW